MDKKVNSEWNIIFVGVGVSGGGGRGRTGARGGGEDWSTQYSNKRLTSEYGISQCGYDGLLFILQGQ